MNRLPISRSFLIVWAGQLVSNLGSRLSGFALGLWILRTTGSTTEFAVTFIVTTIPVIIASPLAGALADRWNRRRIMLLSDALAAGLMIGLAALAANAHLAVWHVYIVAAVTALLDSFRSPAFSASIPLIAAQDQLPRANALVQTGNATASIVGPLLAGVLVSSVTMQGVLIIDALTFVVGVITLALVTIPRPLSAKDQPKTRLLEDAAGGYRYVQQRAGLRGLLGVYCFNHFVFAIASVLIAPLILSFSNPAMVGVQYATSGCGLLLGGLLMTALGGPRRRVNGVLLYSLLGGLALAVHGLRPSLTLIISAGFVLFLMLPVIEASNASLWQTKVPGHLQGRCFAVQQLLLNVAMAIGYCLAGPLSDSVFGPLLKRGGLLTGSVGAVIGMGPGRGVGLIFIVLGLSMAAVAVAGYSLPALRNIDEPGEAFDTSGVLPEVPSDAPTVASQQVTLATSASHKL